MKISFDQFEALLKCPAKCWLRATGELGAGNDYADWVKSQTESYRATEIERLLSEIPQDEPAVAPVPANLKTDKWRLAVDVVAQAFTPAGSCSVSLPGRTRTPDGTPGQSADETSALPTRSEQGLLETHLHAIERIPSAGRGRPAQFVPIRFIYRNKLTKDDRLLLAFDAFVLSQMLGREVNLGKIIHGDDHATLKVKVASLTGEVRKRIEKMTALLASSTPPDLILNRHCAECEFRDRCRQKAIETDDLSLLAGMSAKERQKLHSKGIFTVTQLSYTFRPRRRPKRMRDKREKYHHALKALAIREKKIHIVGNPELKIEGTPVYLDVEGLPDRDFYYLIGLRVGNGDSAVQHSLWADTVAGEGKIWRKFLSILETVEKPVLIHYGSYETTFLKQMKEHYGNPPEESVAAKTIAAAMNVVSVLFAQVYFPTFANGLKEIAGFLGFRWREAPATGLQAIVWRLTWEHSARCGILEQLKNYNAEDCAALEAVARKLLDLHHGSEQTGAPTNGEVVDTAKMKREHPYGFKRNTFAFPELNAINNAAYWDYQRERVYLKSNRSLKHALRQKARLPSALSPNRTVECCRAHRCPKCNSAVIIQHGKYGKTLFDLKFMRYGVKRWITRYQFHRYKCQVCGATFYPEDRCWTGSKFGVNIIAFALYLSIELRLPQIHVDQSLNRLFGFNLPTGSATSTIKERAAATYRDTYRNLLNNLGGGRLLHADETTISIRGKPGFVWVFANMEEVAYVYSETREGDLLQTLLKGFSGVLVSDFYAAYDAIQCPQQKCLIHLIRDLNDDVLKHPYDNELKRLALGFAVLLKPMVDTIDRYGLRSRFLRKHLSAVGKFYRQISVMAPRSEAAVKLKERLEKNRDKLFTFLSFDGVPWNNNNAEHAVKPLAKLRHVIGGVTSEKGIRDYLVLLSVCQTCKYMGVDFLDFLRSGEKNIHAFAESRRRRRRQGCSDRSAANVKSTAASVSGPAPADS